MAQKKPHIAVVLGTARPGRHSENVARLLCNRLETQDAASVELVDVKDHLETAVTARIGKEDPRTTSRWKEISESADAFVFVLPEYNRGYPGEWKLLVDSLPPSEYTHKVAGLVGVSTGVFGGARVLDHVKPVLTELGLIMPKGSLNFAGVADLFDEKGSLANDAQSARVDKFVTTFTEQVILYTSCRK